MSEEHTYPCLYIGGAFVPASGPRLPIVNPGTGAAIGWAGTANAADVDAAVAAARGAFDGTGPGAWSAWSCSQRAALLRAVAARVLERKDALSILESLDVGKPLPESEWDVDDVAAVFEYYAGLTEALGERQEVRVDVGDADYACALAHEPVGVVGAIVPWNYPALMAAWKLAPALAAGCTVVLKSSELTVMTALELARIFDECGCPAGVVNVLTGTGADVGAPLVAHSGVDKVAFTGSKATGAAIMGECARTIKNVTLELGGKSPALVFDDADLERAVEWVMFGCFWTNGQICSATSRLLLHAPLEERFLRRLVEETRRIVVGDALETTAAAATTAGAAAGAPAAAVRLGPLVSAAQRDKVLGFVARATAAGGGAELLTGGGVPPGQHPGGFFVEPTVLRVTDPSCEVWREEVFGPVLSVMTFADEAEAVALANDSQYGLAAAVFTADERRLRRVARAMKAGIVWENCSQPAFPQLPWGGPKKSGLGRELGGNLGLSNYLEPKQITRYVSKEPLGWYFGGGEEEEGKEKEKAPPPQSRL